MSQKQDIVAAARRPGPFFAFAESGRPAIFAWGESKGSGISCRAQKFYFPKDRGSEMWSGFSLECELIPAHSETLERLPLISPARALPEAEAADKDSWEDYCRKIFTQISSGSLKKVVPARTRSFALHPTERSTLLDTVFANLFAPSFSNTFRFLFREQEDIFFGATPELLFRREKGQIFVPAIAGTRSLVHGTEAEAAQALMGSAKELKEHAFVVEGILESLRSLGLKPKAPSGPDLLKVPGLLHLYTPISAEDSPSISSDKLMSALHPTPAIGGSPKMPAKDFLFDNEPWDRGLFASPMLFKLHEKELCLVVIRSGLLTSNALHLFAGAGFVSESQAESEWAETERKIDVLQSLLTGKAL